MHIICFLDSIPESVHSRQDCVPIVYVTGSHYEVGYMIVSTNLCLNIGISFFFGTTNLLHRVMNND